MNQLLKSRKFWVAILDVAVSFATYFVTRYVAPDLAKDILFVLGGLQPVWLMVIGSIAAEDVAAIRSGTHITQEPKIKSNDDSMILVRKQ